MKPRFILYRLLYEMAKRVLQSVKTVAGTVFWQFAPFRGKGPIEKSLLESALVHSIKWLICIPFEFFEIMFCFFKTFFSRIAGQNLNQL
jgi:hypothetical protein